MGIAWKKSSLELTDIFYNSLPKDELVEQRKMFGYPCAFVQGNMFAGLHQENMAVRLPEPSREAMTRLKGAGQFEPLPGRIMKEYITVPETVLKDPKELAKLVLEAFEYALSLKAKSKKKAARVPKSKKTR
jgi:TfoX/Sxy family transcriptional regulator of competence genes